MNPVTNHTHKNNKFNETNNETQPTQVDGQQARSLPCLNPHPAPPTLGRPKCLDGFNGDLILSLL